MSRVWKEREEDGDSSLYVPPWLILLGLEVLPAYHHRIHPIKRLIRPECSSPLCTLFLLPHYWECAKIEAVLKGKVFPTLQNSSWLLEYPAGFYSSGLPVDDGAALP